MSKTSLATKGKRLFDRAHKDIKITGVWLGSEDLKKIQDMVNCEFTYESTNADESEKANEIKNNVDTETPSFYFDPNFDGKEPESPEYKKLKERAFSLFFMLKDIAVPDQNRKTLHKKAVPTEKEQWYNRIVFEVINSQGRNAKESITLLNTAIYASAAVFTFRDGDELKSNDRETGARNKIPKEEPMWLIRLQKKILTLRKEADILNAHLSNKIKKESAKDYLRQVCKKYSVNGTKAEIKSKLFAVKNQISLTANKIRRYKVQMRAHEQNALFSKDKKAFYRELNGKKIKVENIPKEEEIKAFWQDEIWGKQNGHNQEAEWIKEMKENYKVVPEQEWKEINEYDVTMQIAKQANWKAPGIDGVPNFWIKKSQSIHAWIAVALNKCVEDPCLTPEWLPYGRTVLLPKTAKTEDPKSYHPITCLTTCWKALTGILAGKIETHLNAHKILADEQQGARRNSYGTKRQLIVNKTILEHALRNRRSLSMAYIDYQKAYDSVPHSWIIESLKLYKVSKTIIAFLEHTICMWKTTLTLNHENGSIKIENIQIRRGIFQGNSLSPLLFIIALNPLSKILNKNFPGYDLDGIAVTHTFYMDDLKLYGNCKTTIHSMLSLVERFSKDINMLFGLNKCNVIHMNKGKYERKGSIEISDGNLITELGEDQFYKYLGIEELVDVRHTEMKDKISSEVKRRTKLILKSDLNARNTFEAISELALPVLTYSFAIINWTEAEIKSFDVMVRKQLHMHRHFEIKSDIDRLYVPRLMGGRGLQSAWDLYRSAIARYGYYLKEEADECLMKCADLDESKLFSIIKRAEKISETTGKVEVKDKERKTLLQQAREIAVKTKEQLVKIRMDTLKAKPQHGAFFRQIDEIPDVDTKESHAWLSRGHLAPGVESKICAAQEMALITRWHEKNILNNRKDDVCRLCHKAPESIYHITSGCDTLAKKEYFDRHDTVGKVVHHAICKHYGVSPAPNWFKHNIKEVVSTKDVDILWDQIIMTDRKIGANRPDIVVRDKQFKKAYIIDFSCPCDLNVKKKENEKVLKYAGLKVELSRMWNVQCEIIPVIIGGLGVVTKDFKKFLKIIPGKPNPNLCQKAAILGTEKILRSFLSRQNMR